jgi:CRP/FNR family cyclic AMP-dependent transcriptional regulator
VNSVVNSRYNQTLAQQRVELNASTSGIVLAHLVDVPLFSTCTKRELKLVAKLARLERRASGAALTTQGMPGSEMFIVLQGTARVVRNGRKIADIGPGAAVGEIALLVKTPRNASVIATSPLEAAVLGGKEFAKLLDSSPGFDRKLLESLAGRIRELDSNAV